MLVDMHTRARALASMLLMPMCNLHTVAHVIARSLACALPFPSLHLTSLHPFTSLHFSSLLFTSLHFTSLHFLSHRFVIFEFGQPQLSAGNMLRDFYEYERQQYTTQGRLYLGNNAS